MRHEIQSHQHLSSKPLPIRLSCLFRVGGILLLMLFYLPMLRSQISCSPYEFEVVKTEPNLNHYPSNVTGPSAFHTYYTVRLKITSGVFPNAWEVSHLAFSGRIKVNNFTSRIDRDLTVQLHTNVGGTFSNPYFQYLDQAALANGEVVWKVGEDEECEEMNPANNISIPLPQGLTSVNLFTIAVAGTPGDFTTFINLGGTVCVPGCTGGMPVVYTPPLDVVFPTPPDCAPPVSVTFSEIFIGNERHILVTLNGLTPGGTVRKMDGVIHIQPNMNGISDLDLVANVNSGGPIGVDRRKNSDGSFDFYFFSTWQGSFQWANSVENIFTIMVGGQYNLSQGGNLICTLPSGRGAFANAFGVTNVCSLSADPTTIVIDGYPLCDKELTISATRYVGPDCQLGALYTLNFTGSGTLDLDFLHLRLGFNTDDAANPPTQVDAPLLPCPSCWTITEISPGVYTCEYEYNSPLALQNGTTVTVPFTINQDCVRFYVLMAEATITNGTGTCALGADIDLNNFPACDPSVHGRIILSDDQTGVLVNNYMVTLVGQTGYFLQNFDDCQEEYSFCPDVSKAPFSLTVQTRPGAESKHCECGVTAFDMNLINRHILGIQTLAPPYRLIAADAGRPSALSPIAITTYDITQIRRCILGYQTDFGPFTNPSWWYINDAYQFPNDPDKIFQELDWQTSNIVQVPANGQGDYGLFHAVKVGDVNLNCNCTGYPPSIASNASSRSTSTGFRIDAEKIRQVGNLVQVPVFANSAFELAALQGGFRFDASIMSLSGVIPNAELGIADQQFGTLKAGDGEIRFAWIPEDGETPLPGNALLFTLEFELKNDFIRPSGQFCWLSDNILNNLAYPADGKEFKAQLAWGNAEKDYAGLALMVSPNPFQGTTKLFVYSEKAQSGVLRFQDSRGAVQVQKEVALAEGENVFDIQSGVLPGIYFFTIDAGGLSIQRQVVKL